MDIPCPVRISLPIIISYRNGHSVTWKSHVISFLSSNSDNLNLAFTVLFVDICPAAVSHIVLDLCFLRSFLTLSALMILLLAPVSKSILISLYLGFPNLMFNRPKVTGLRCAVFCLLVVWRPARILLTRYTFSFI